MKVQSLKDCSIKHCAWACIKKESTAVVSLCLERNPSSSLVISVVIKTSTSTHPFSYSHSTLYSIWGYILHLFKPRHAQWFSSDSIIALKSQSKRLHSSCKVFMADSDPSCLALIPQLLSSFSGFNQSECSSEPYFTCRNGKCIPLGLVCDDKGIDNCGDGSDLEENLTTGCKGQLRDEVTHQHLHEFITARSKSHS